MRNQVHWFTPYFRGLRLRRNGEETCVECCCVGKRGLVEAEALESAIGVTDDKVQTEGLIEKLFKELTRIFIGRKAKALSVQVPHDIMNLDPEGPFGASLVLRGQRRCPYRPW